jgi:hypothetical protein
VVNLSEAYRIVLPKSANDEKTKVSKRDPLKDEIVALHDAGVTTDDIVVKTGASERTIRRELEAEALRRGNARPDGA